MGLYREGDIAGAKNATVFITKKEGHKVEIGGARGADLINATIPALKRLT